MPSARAICHASSRHAAPSVRQAEKLAAADIKLLSRIVAYQLDPRRRGGNAKRVIAGVPLYFSSSSPFGDNFDFLA